jgi:hypothetical protein
VPITIEPNGKNYSDEPRKAAPSEELRGDDGANSMNTRIQKQKMDHRANIATGRVTRMTPGFPSTRDARSMLRKKRLAEKRNDPVST